LGKLGFFYHEDYLSHLVPDGHPENISRLYSVLSSIKSQKFSNLEFIKPPLATDKTILLGHSQSYLQNLYNLSPTSTIISLDQDTFMSPGTLSAAKRGVGAITAAIDCVMSQKIENAFCAVRPPGHHAEKNTAMGFCFLNSIGIGAIYALNQKSIGKVAVVDFDIHHGNGTQDFLFNRPNCLFISIHQKMLFPNTGNEKETGLNDNILNIPVSPLSDSADLRYVFDKKVVPKLESFKPDFLLISAGFDGHKNDQISQTNWLTEDYSYITNRLKEFAREHCKSRIVSSLEGGYEITSLGACCKAHINALLE
jgi:acetoin utilization deacetylase AcuC-like enzyme